MDWDDVKFFGSIILMVVLLFAVIAGAVVGLGVISEQGYCRTMESLHDGYEFQWVFYGGCLVKTPSGFWINAHEYRYLEGDVR